MKSKRVKFKALRVMTATSVNKEDSTLIVERMKEADIPVWRSFSETTRGTRCVSVYVDETKYEQAREIAADLLPAMPFLEGI